LVSDASKAKSTAGAKVAPSPLENYSHSFIVCISKVFLAYPHEDKLKALLEPYLHLDKFDPAAGVVTPTLLSQCRRKAILQLVLLTSQPAALGSWSVLSGDTNSVAEEDASGPDSESKSDGVGGGPNPIMHLMCLISVGSSPTGVSSLPNYYYNQYVATEVICLAASEPSCHPVLAPLLSSSVLTSLMEHSPFVATRAAAASTLTKLGLKAAAIKNSSDEIASYLNTISDILQLNCTSRGGNDYGGGVGKGLVSFSAFDNTAVIGNSPSALSSSPSNSAQLSSSSSSLERCIEMLAALAGKTFVKEEIVHGSYRCGRCQK
jgi:hypothetical protein